MKRKLSKAVIAILCIAVIVVGVIGTVSKISNQKGKEYKVEDFHASAFGDNVFIFSPEDDPSVVQDVLNEIYEKQEANQFGEERYAVYFLPGEYDDSLEINVGFYTQVAGLGKLPTDTNIPGIICLARWLSDDESNHNACCNFWRSVENVKMTGNVTWAVSQATDMRRVMIDGSLYLHDNYGWCSGGFLADSVVTRMVDSGSQQQWLSRNNEYKCWMDDNWNIVFLGDVSEIKTLGTWPVKAYTTIEETPVVREKPFLAYDENQGYGVILPQYDMNRVGTSWNQDNKDNTFISLENFYIAHADVDDANTINEALEAGKHLLLTPGIYDLSSPIKVTNPDTIVLGMGLATLRATDGNECLVVSDVNGVSISGILFDAGPKASENLLVVGEDKNNEAGFEKFAPITLSDVFFRVGGTPTDEPSKVKACVTINSDNVIGDNLWVWRADHGDMVAWDQNVADNGIIINGDNVTMYALMVEHFEKYQTVWNGNNGTLYMYQSEVPYDVASQEEWMSHDGEMPGYASIYVADDVTDFEAQALGIYLYNRDRAVEMFTAMEVPNQDGVSVHNICTVMLNGYPGMDHIINDAGDAVTTIVDREIIIDYCNGTWK